jgi:RNA-directed DNA polymerase
LNSDAPWPRLAEANARVLDHQRKLHRWADIEPERRFDDLFNLVCDPATLVVAWHRVMRNRGARTAGVDTVTRGVAERRGMDPFLADLRADLRDGTFRALPVRKVGIPKRGGKVRYLGIPTLRDRVAQMALKLVLEPVLRLTSPQRLG